MREKVFELCRTDAGDFEEVGGLGKGAALDDVVGPQGCSLLLLADLAQASLMRG